MSTLHTVNKSPLTSHCILSCLRLAATGDSILFIEDGVYGVLQQTSFTSQLEQIFNKYTLYALKPDLAARGIIQRAHPRVQLIDYDEFVKLSIAHQKVQAWF